LDLGGLQPESKLFRLTLESKEESSFLGQRYAIRGVIIAIIIDADIATIIAIDAKVKMYFDSMYISN
jgi:hypothetical protein